MKRDVAYLKHILDSIHKIEGYLSDVDFDAFLEDQKTQDAVVRNLEMIGVASKKLSEETRRRYTQVPWTLVAGTRDRLIHAYFDVDLEEVWSTVCRDIPALKVAVQKAINELDLLQE